MPDASGDFRGRGGKCEYCVIILSARVISIGRKNHFGTLLATVLEEEDGRVRN